MAKPEWFRAAEKYARQRRSAVSPEVTNERARKQDKWNEAVSRLLILSKDTGIVGLFEELDVNFRQEDIEAEKRAILWVRESLDQSGRLIGQFERDMEEFKALASVTQRLSLPPKGVIIGNPETDNSPTLQWAMRWRDIDQIDTAGHGKSGDFFMIHFESVEVIVDIDGTLEFIGAERVFLTEEEWRRDRESIKEVFGNTAASPRKFKEVGRKSPSLYEETKG